jgi:hypothetical protein
MLTVTKVIRVGEYTVDREAIRSLIHAIFLYVILAVDFLALFEVINEYNTTHIPNTNAITLPADRLDLVHRVQFTRLRLTLDSGVL